MNIKEAQAPALGGEVEDRSDTGSVPTEEGSTHDAVVIGAGQAGLAVGYHLARQGANFVIVDAGPEVGHVWRSRWDSLRLFTPAGFSGLPGMGFPGSPDTYPGKDDVADYLQAYASRFRLPVLLDTRVSRLGRRDGRYVLSTPHGELSAGQVVIATGPFHTPYVPAVAAGAEPGMTQLHSAHYRRPDQLPAGRTLVVGGGNSGFQIAEELAATRGVDLAVGQRLPSLPQRVLGRDLFWWLSRIGAMKVNLDTRMGRRMSERDFLIGSSPRRARDSGVTFRGRLLELSGRRARFADGGEVEVDGIVWATGYRPDYSWLDIPGVVGDGGVPVHRRGLTISPGLYFVGLTWQRTRGSALIGFVHEDAAFIATQVGASIPLLRDEGAITRTATTATSTSV